MILIGAALENFLLESLKKLFVVSHLQPKLGKRAMSIWIFSQYPPLPILSNAIFIEIDPHGKGFVMVIPQAHGVGKAVAWGHNFHVQL